MAKRVSTASLSPGLSMSGTCKTIVNFLKILSWKSKVSDDFNPSAALQMYNATMCRVKNYLSMSPHCFVVNSYRLFVLSDVNVCQIKT